jgi:hypothetical protein
MSEAAWKDLRNFDAHMGERHREKALARRVLLIMCVEK